MSHKLSHNAIHSPFPWGQHGWPPRLKNLMGLIKRCEEAQLAIVDVPADGNCLVWSLRVLQSGQIPQLDPQCVSKKAKKQMQELRDSIAAAWVTVKDFGLWQTLFKYFCANHVRDDPPETPPKKQKKNAEPCPAKTPDAATPPRPEPSQPRQVQRVDGAQAVPISKKRLPESPNLMQPQKKKARELMEPEVPDVEEAFHQTMQEEASLSERLVEDVRPEMLSSGAAEAVAPKKIAHERRYKSRPKTAREISIKLVDNFLAARGITYLSHCRLHRQQAVMRKAAVCVEGGWKEFKEHLLGAQLPKCEICLGIMRDSRFTLDDIAVELEAEQSKLVVAPEKSDKAGSSAPDGTQPEAAGDQQPENTDAQDEVERCKAYVTSFGPVIELLEENGKFGYRCRACRTRKQPLGKVNKLPKMIMKSVKNYLEQHLNCPTHIGKVNMMKATDVKLDSERQQPLECPGLCVSNATGSSLYHYLPEFKLWISHSQMLSNANQHTYTCKLNAQEWWVKHQNCLGQYIPGDEDESSPCCKQCRTLGEPHSIQRKVVKFATKFYAAHLLKRRLFCQEESVTALLDEVGATTFAHNNSKLWKNVTELSNAGLQALVRRTWGSMPPQARNDIVNVFYGTVVEPCTKIHVGSVSSNLVCLSSQFLDALSNRENSEPWQMLGKFGECWGHHMCRFFPSIKWKINEK